MKNIELFMDSTEKENMGFNARRFYEKFFARDRFMDKLEKEMMYLKSR